MTKKMLIYRVVLCVLILSLLIFIFVHSSKHGDESYNQSEEVVGGVLDVIAPDIGSDPSAEGYQTRLYINLAFRKMAHLCLFAGLSFLMSLLLTSYEMKKWKVALFSIGFTVLYAISDEVHQMFVPNRAGTLFDVGVDSLGAVLGWACAIFAIWLFWNVQRRKQKVK